MWFEYTKELKTFSPKQVKVTPKLDKFRINKIYINKTAFDEQYNHAKGAASGTDPNLYTLNTAFCDAVMKDVLKDLSRRRYDVSEEMEFKLKEAIFYSLYFHHPVQMHKDLTENE